MRHGEADAHAAASDDRPLAPKLEIHVLLPRALTCSRTHEHPAGIALREATSTVGSVKPFKAHRGRFRQPSVSSNDCFSVGPSGSASGDEPADEPGQRAEELVEQAD